MSGLLSRLLRRSRAPAEEPTGPESAEWASPEADLRRQLKTLEVAYAMKTISRERYEDQRRRLERRLAETDG